MNPIFNGCELEFFIYIDRFRIEGFFNLFFVTIRKVVTVSVTECGRGSKELILLALGVAQPCHRDDHVSYLSKGGLYG